MTDEPREWVLQKAHDFNGYEFSGHTGELSSLFSGERVSICATNPITGIGWDMIDVL